MSKKEHINIILLLPLLFISFSELVFSQSDILSGIELNSDHEDRSKNSSIYLNGGKPLNLENSFSISFDLSFWNYKKFGPILRIGNETGNEIIVVYNQHTDRDISYIEIIEPSKNRKLKIPFPKKELARNKWYNLRLTFDKYENSIKFYMDKTFRDKISYELKGQYLFDFVFGIKNWDNPHDFDVPAISIKNILITEQNKRKYFWSLNPDEENVYQDKINGSKLKVVNAGWVYNRHKIWRKLADLKISDTPLAHLGVAYDPIDSRLYIDRRKDLLIYDLITGKDSAIKYKTSSPAYWNDLFYDYDQKLLYSYMTGMGQVSIYDIDKNEWTITDKSINTNGHYFGSAKFSNPRDEDLFLLGGYGWYSVKNDLFKYNFVKKEWQKVILKKNEMTPRAWFTIGKGFIDGEYLIYGGTGNETGEQENGFSLYYDLFLLNMNDSSITKIILSKTQKFSYSFLFNNSYLDKRDSSIYFLSQSEEGKSFPVSLVKLDLNSREAFPIANKFWNRNAGKWIYAHLHYNKSTNELISVIFDTTNVEVYAINYPPIYEKKEINTAEQVTENNISTFILLTAGLILFIPLAVYYIRRRKRDSLSKIITSIAISESNQTDSPALKNFIKLLGGFHIYNREGKNIISEFSPKLKEILLLIILRSFNHYQHKGITSEELSSVIWPDSSSENVKSSRGVAINKIRKILNSVDSIDLEFVDKVWLIKINNGSRCDYLEFLSLHTAQKNENHSTNNLLLPLINVLDGGEFLKGISYAWLDSIKFSVNNDIIRFLKQQYDSEELKEDGQKLIMLCDAILTFDSIDQHAIKLKIRTLYFEGKQHIAKNSYNLFVTEYKKLYDEHYPFSFNEIIS